MNLQKSLAIALVASLQIFCLCNSVVAIEKKGIANKQASQEQPPYAPTAGTNLSIDFWQKVMKLGPLKQSQSWEYQATASDIFRSETASASSMVTVENESTLKGSIQVNTNGTLCDLSASLALYTLPAMLSMDHAPNDIDEYTFVGNEDVRTFAGEFKNSYRVVKKNEKGRETAWYMPGVGLVRKTIVSSSSGSLQSTTIELTKFSK